MSYEERGLVFEHILSGNQTFYILLTLCVMRDHVHLVLFPKERVISDILKGIKGVTARKINIVRNTKGSVWLDESYDRIIRSMDELKSVLDYIYGNPKREQQQIPENDENEFWYYNEDFQKMLINE